LVAGYVLAWEVYMGSLSRALRELYPNFHWIMTKFDHQVRSSPEYLDNEENQRKFIEQIKKDENLDSMDQLEQKLTYSLIQSRGGM